MARGLTFELDQIMKGQAETRSPGYQILIYDLRSTTDTIRDIVLGNTLDALTGPFDITDFTAQVQIIEQAGTYSAGVASTQITATVVDPGDFDPLLTRTDPTVRGRFFRSGNVLRIIEGDNQVPAIDWKITFTGVLLAQSGYDRNRATLTSSLKLKAVSREATFIHFVRTSEEFLINTTYLSAALSVAQNEMGLDFDEIDFPTFGSQLIPHKVVQLVEETPMTMLARIMFLDSLIPRFTGEGKLGAAADRATGAPARTYLTRNHIQTISRPFSDVQPPNKVCVVGLDSNLSKVTMPNQALATLDITTGYFTPAEKVKVFFRDDRTLFAENVRLKVFRSVDGGLLSFGGGESIKLIKSGDPDQIGTVGVILETETGYAPWLIVHFMLAYLGLSAIPDAWAGFGAGNTIPIGRVIAGLSLIAALMIMAGIGRGSYAFTGDPFEYVYKEIRRCAKIAGIDEFEENVLNLENHLVTTEAQADAVAFQQLFIQQATKAPRQIVMVHDLGLQPNDIFEFQDSATPDRYLVASITRTLTPAVKRIPATVVCFEVTDDISVGT